MLTNNCHYQDPLNIKTAPDVIKFPISFNDFKVVKPLIFISWWGGAKAHAPTLTQAKANNNNGGISYEK